jgi:hypothetical protein
MQVKVNFNIGDQVRSHFRAAWTGHVVEQVPRFEPCSLCKDRYCYVVMITHDRRGNPVRKPFRSQILDACWLRRISVAA